MITINTQLINDDPFGTRVLTLENTNCKMFIIKRGDEHLAENFQELQKHAFYILLGHERMNRRRQSYIGQTSNALKRLKQHASSKDFWEYMCIFINTGEEFDRAEIMYLEYLGIKTAIETASFDLLENCQIPIEPSLNSTRKDEIRVYFDRIRLLMNHCGFYLFYRKQFIMEDFSRNKKHNIISRITKTYRDLKDTVFDEYYDEDEEEPDNMEIWKGDTWKVQAMSIPEGKYMLFPGGQIKPFEDTDDSSRKSLVEKQDIRLDNMYINGFITCNNEREARIIVEGKCDNIII